MNDFESEAETVGGAEAQVIPLHGPGREKPAAEREVREPAAPREDAPVVAFPRADRVAQAPEILSDAARSALGFLRDRLTGDYEVDEFGFDAALTEAVFLPPLRALYKKWFRVDTFGVENLPASGGALLVSNHSGTVPLVGSFARKSGQTLACQADAERLLRRGELVGVWPEGFKGIGKPFSSRYKLQRFGRGGFVSAALHAGVPIIPVSVIGAEEIYPKLGDLKLLARMFGLPYFPVTPFFPHFGLLGAIPLPTKWSIEFGEPIRTDSFGPEAVEDPMLVFQLTDQVRESIQQTLYRRLSQRKSVFRG